MCTVLLRLDPDSAWPLQVGAIRDEFTARAWDPPARHWSGRWGRFVGGRDRVAGGTWLAVDPSGDQPRLAAVLNGRPLGPAVDGAPRPTRGELALRALAGDGLPEGDELLPYDRFHLLLASSAGAALWSWDGEALVRRILRGRHHIVVNAGLDAASDPLVGYFRERLAAAAAPEVDEGAGWGGWPELLTGDRLPGDDPRALVVAKTIDGRQYGTTSSSMIAFGRDGAVRYAFTATPADPASWSTVPAVA